MLVFRAFTIAAGVVLTAAQLPGQMGAPSRSSGTMGGADAGGLGSAGSATANNPNSPMGTNTPFPGQRGSIYLSGKVVLDDGTAISEPVLIERVCNGIARTEGYTDVKGRFSFQLGQNPEAPADASENIPDISANSTRRPGESGQPNELMNCGLRASLPGFHSDSVALGGHQYLDNSNVGTITLHRMANVEGFTTSATSVLAPKDARKAYDRGLEDIKKQKPEEAQKELEKAVGSYPKYAAAWFLLGELDEEHGHVDDARKAYTQSIAADGKYINPYERLYMLAFKDEKWQEAADDSNRVLHLNPYDFPAAYYANAVANLQLQHLDAAEKSARAAVKVDDAHRNPRAPYVLGLILAQKKDFAESVEYLRAYVNAAPNAPDAAVAREQLAEAEKQVPTKPQSPPEN